MTAPKTGDAEPTPDIARIATSLTKAETRALHQLRSFHHARDFIGVGMGTMKSLGDKRLVKRRLPDAWCLTPPGLAVQAFLRESGDDQ